MNHTLTALEHESEEDRVLQERVNFDNLDIAEGDKEARIEAISAPLDDLRTDCLIIKAVWLEQTDFTQQPAVAHRRLDILPRTRRTIRRILHNPTQFGCAVFLDDQLPDNQTFIFAYYYNKNGADYILWLRIIPPFPGRSGTADFAFRPRHDPPENLLTYI